MKRRRKFQAALIAGALIATPQAYATDTCGIIYDVACCLWHGCVRPCVRGIAKAVLNLTEKKIQDEKVRKSVAKSLARYAINEEEVEETEESVPVSLKVRDKDNKGEVNIHLIVLTPEHVKSADTLATFLHQNPGLEVRVNNNQYFLTAREQVLRPVSNIKSSYFDDCVGSREARARLREGTLSLKKDVRKLSKAGEQSNMYEGPEGSLFFQLNALTFVQVSPTIPGRNALSRQRSDLYRAYSGSVPVQTEDPHSPVAHCLNLPSPSTSDGKEGGEIASPRLTEGESDEMRRGQASFLSIPQVPRIQVVDADVITPPQVRIEISSMVAQDIGEKKHAEVTPPLQRKVTFSDQREDELRQVNTDPRSRSLNFPRTPIQISSSAEQVRYSTRLSARSSAKRISLSDIERLATPRKKTGPTRTEGRKEDANKRIQVGARRNGNLATEQNPSPSFLQNRSVQGKERFAGIQETRHPCFVNRNRALSPMERIETRPAVLRLPRIQNEGEL